MSDEPENLVLKHLVAMREEMRAGFAKIDVLDRKVGALAEGMVALRKRVDDIAEEVSALHGDMRMIAIAVDEHTIRLDHIEKHLGMDKSRN